MQIVKGCDNAYYCVFRDEFYGSFHSVADAETSIRQKQLKKSTTKPKTYSLIKNIF